MTAWPRGCIVNKSKYRAYEKQKSQEYAQWGACAGATCCTKVDYTARKQELNKDLNYSTVTHKLYKRENHIIYQVVADLSQNCKSQAAVAALVRTDDAKHWACLKGGVKFSSFLSLLYFTTPEVPEVSSTESPVFCEARVRVRAVLKDIDLRVICSCGDKIKHLTNHAVEYPVSFVENPNNRWRQNKGE
ncbi:hypothetical protein RRG08_016849 [Elysia crispata]|uniref:Uncharacterized protein n=1 Tax=Elysia crispata TaxID=231223 RepID=A0AAE0XMF3_9GAST|nr:hypothetical protein RRG08_016849 [Elysia crispata]